MPAAPTFPLYDRLLNGRLRAVLSDLSAAGLSTQQVRDRLRDEHQIDVSTATVKRWLEAGT